MSSLKATTKPNKTSVSLGNEIYESLYTKCIKFLAEANLAVRKSEQELKNIDNLPEDTEEQKIVKDFKNMAIEKEILKNEDRVDLLKKMYDELSQMKSGSIALINQITTISKQRIYNPKKDFDILSDIKLSKEKMNLIDEKIKKFYIN